MPYRGNNENKSTGGANWLGFQEVALTDVVDKSNDYSEMDMFLNFSFRNQNSQYPTDYSLMGSFDKDSTGRVEGDSGLLKRIIYICDALGFSGGVDTQGTWVDKDDKPIDDIAGFLNVNYSVANYGLNDGEDEHKYFIFVYKKWNEKAKKAYTTVCPKIVPNTPAGQRDLKSYIDWMKKNGYIKEHDDQDEPVMAHAEGSAATAGAFDKF